MMQLLRYVAVLILPMLFLCACEREVVEPTVLDTSYFPLETGKYSVYKVDSVIYNDFEQTVDTATFFLKEEIGETETDNLGRVYYRLNRYKKYTNTDLWNFDGVWAVQQVDQYAYRIENNLRYVNLVFPLTLDKTWDGITYLRRDTTIAIPGGAIDLYKDWEDFKIISLGEVDTINGTVYNEVTTVLKVDKVNNIERRYAIEKYAKHVGLVYKLDSILDTQCGGNISPACITEEWAIKAEKGYILEQELIETNW